MSFRNQIAIECLCKFVLLPC